MNYSIEALLADLSREFEHFTFSFKENKYQGIIPCFFINVNSEEKLYEFWMKISDFIAVNYQSRLNDEFSIWNIYLFFLVGETIGNELKYLIENDTFSSRKILIEKNTGSNKIFEEHILNNDIQIDISKTREMSFYPNPIFFGQVSNIEAKSKVTNEIKDAYSVLKSKLIEANNEN